MNFPLAIACALLSSVCLAWGAERQGGAVRKDHHAGVGLSALGSLFRHPRWLFGLGLMAVGTVLNVIALALAPITVVQPIGALALVMTAVLNARATSARLGPRMLAAIGACLVGSAAFVILGLRVRNEAAGIGHAETVVVLILTWAAIAVCAALVAFGARRLPAFACVVVSGVLYGLVAVQVKVLATSVMGLDGLSPDRLWGWLTEDLRWAVLAGVVVAAVLGGWFVQKAYASGPPDLVIAGLTVIDPFVGVAVGIAVFHELRPDVPPAAAMGMALAAVVAMLGVITLARHHPDVDGSKASHRRPELLSDDVAATSLPSDDVTRTSTPDARSTRAHL
ncbi:DMT family transporter [Falsarthrobacter nasiphocae]|uniref:Membrane protein n=1 Tax=Falsarthrobacter nasiphocae TaxID=189863 RepID=A0AAE3YIH5_9MICC|nr:DMT family transporter [Falsarthrobacter nasiphocae]MDR6892631.1 putative membrane protein [Falsarthrobacter nasiphocae]